MHPHYALLAKQLLSISTNDATDTVCDVLCLPQVRSAVAALAVVTITDCSTHCSFMLPQVRSDVAALALEEVAPLAVSTAALSAPSEVFTAAAPGGEGKAEQELSR